MKKSYLAVVDGEIAADVTIDAPIARTGEATFGVDAAGRESQTVVTPIATSSGATLAEIQLETGRTHQIRIHLASIGHPVLGDRKYGPATRTAPRLMLHAWLIEHQSIGRLIAPPPEDFAAFCAGCGWSLPYLEVKDGTRTSTLGTGGIHFRGACCLWCIFVIRMLNPVSEVGFFSKYLELHRSRPWQNMCLKWRLPFHLQPMR